MLSRARSGLCSRSNWTIPAIPVPSPAPDGGAGRASPTRRALPPPCPTSFLPRTALYLGKNELLLTRSARRGAGGVGGAGGLSLRKMSAGPGRGLTFWSRAAGGAGRAMVSRPTPWQRLENWSTTTGDTCEGTQGVGYNLYSFPHFFYF